MAADQLQLLGDHPHRPPGRFDQVLGLECRHAPGAVQAEDVEDLRETPSEIDGQWRGGPVGHLDDVLVRGIEVRGDSDLVFCLKVMF